MPILTLNIDHSGRPIIEVFVGVTKSEREALQEANREVPPQQSILALVDTGASKTFIEKSVIELLGLTPTGDDQFNSATSGDVPIFADTYLLELSLAGEFRGVLASSLTVIESEDLSRLGVRALLGRDILQNGLLFYDGPRNQFTLAIDAQNEP